jgi:hypothetical protein
MDLGFFTNFFTQNFNAGFNNMGVLYPHMGDFILPPSYPKVNRNSEVQPPTPNKSPQEHTSTEQKPEETTDRKDDKNEICILAPDIFNITDKEYDQLTSKTYNAKYSSELRIKDDDGTWHMAGEFYVTPYDISYEAKKETGQNSDSGNYNQEDDELCLKGK